MPRSIVSRNGLLRCRPPGPLTRWTRDKPPKTWDHATFEEIAEARRIRSRAVKWCAVCCCHMPVRLVCH
jgi:hypothetical protein